MIKYPSIEFQPLAEQRLFQEKKLLELVQYLQAHSPFYQQWFERHHIDIHTIKSLDDLTKIPTVGKEDIQKSNFDFLCVPRTNIVEYTSTSGTLGSPVTIALTNKDVDRLAYNEALSFSLMDLKAGDALQLMLTLDRQFMAGTAYYLGAQKQGIATIRTGPGLPSMQLDTIKRLGVTALVAVPSFLLKMIDYFKSIHLDPNSLPVKKVLCIGENIRTSNGALNALGTLIQESWNVELFSTYASTEMQTAFTECTAGCGGHHHPELTYIEILDEDGQRLPAGVYGEVTISTLGVEAMPLLRYRTGDICCYFEEECTCGRKSIRLSAVAGRKKQMIKFKGTTLYPPAIFDILNQSPAIQDYVVEVKSSDIDTDDLVLHIHTTLSVDECERQLKPFLQSRLRVVPTILYHSSSEMMAMLFPLGSRKAMKFIDNRKANDYGRESENR